jgi:UDP-N-acetylmuramoylalanine--D-glutamate ligase
MIPLVKDRLFWVVGLGRSGCAAGALLRRHGAKVIGVDDAAEDTVSKRWEREGLSNLAPRAFNELATSGDWPSAAPTAVILSPGVPTGHPRLQELPAGTEVMGEIELASRFCPAPVVGITGTNGKSTTTELVAHLARKAGRQAEALGNLGTPWAQVADSLSADTLVSLELSSFQLETISSFQPRVGLVLNLAPDHLDRYPDLPAYYAAKRRLAECIADRGDFITWTECPEARTWPCRGTVSLSATSKRGRYPSSGTIRCIWARALGRGACCPGASWPCNRPPIS